MFEENFKMLIGEIGIVFALLPDNRSFSAMACDGINRPSFFIELSSVF